MGGESTNDKIVAERDRCLQRVADFTEREFDRWVASTGSPIEALFLATWLASERPWYPLEIVLDGAARRGVMTGAGILPLLVIPQCSVRVVGSSYRLDLAVLEYHGSTVVTRVDVECDGHDFHERTKEQAKSDKSRDRALQTAGWSVLRFTGSEIYADARGCLHQVYTLFIAKHAEREQQRDS